MVGGDRATDKMHFRYRKVDWIDPDTKEKRTRNRPQIEVIFRKNAEIKSEENPEFRIFGLVDSGADNCFLPRQIADILKLELDEAKKKTSKSASGDFSTIPSEVHLEILYKNRRVVVGMVSVSVQVEYADEEDVINIVLLGRSELFLKYEITFNDLENTINFKKIGANQNRNLHR